MPKAAAIAATTAAVIRRSATRISPLPRHATGKRATGFAERIAEITAFLLLRRAGMPGSVLPDPPSPRLRVVGVLFNVVHAGTPYRDRALHRRCRRSWPKACPPRYCP